ncbi:hypothetical protein [Burkholderia sp. BCC0405]|uniref:hypothetical protein n=1 Tax=Burkholderia sp. BCC0405 TaxID=2676298 RepID=UPI00158A0028|nr:hypothetical protein [Burkholderia sp. BCC0405]
MAKYITISSTGAITGMYDDEIRPPPLGSIEVSDSVFKQCGPNVAYVNGMLEAYTAPVAPLTIQQQAQNAFSAGLTVTSSSTPSLSGTFSVNNIAQQRVMAEVTSILLNGTFANGSDTAVWQDASGTEHTFTIAQFKEFASVFSAYVASVTMCMLGQSSALPSSDVTIA